MNLLKYSLLALLLAACSGGDSDGGPDASTVPDARIVIDVIDSGPISDGMNQTPDATLAIPDAAIGIVDAAITPPDGGIVVPPDAAIGPDAAVGVPTQCVDACAELTVCFGDGPVGECETACTTDVLDCSPAQFIEFDACNAMAPGVDCNTLIACLSAIACIEAGDPDPGNTPPSP